jgi:hypothetical protein
MAQVGMAQVGGVQHGRTQNLWPLDGGGFLRGVFSPESLFQKGKLNNCSAISAIRRSLVHVLPLILRRFLGKAQSQQAPPWIHRRTLP